MWAEVITGVSVLTAIVSTAAWLRTRARLAESRREQEALEKSSRVFEEEQRVVELVARGGSLTEALDTLTRAIEKMTLDCVCTVLLLDEDRLHLLKGSGGEFA